MRGYLLVVAGVSLAVSGCAGEASPDDGTGANADELAASCSQVNFDVNKYTASNPGCGGYATGCKGQLHLVNTGDKALGKPVIRIPVPKGVSCTRSHSSAKWTITDNGRSSGLCVFTARNPDASGNGWSIAPAGGTFGFGYDTSSSSFTAPTGVTVSDTNCQAPPPPPPSQDLGTTPTPRPDLATPPPPPPNTGMTPSQKLVAEEITSIWENDTPKIAYDYAENIKDGRGYTSGRAGFCTGTGDAIMVIDCYDKLRTVANGNLMAKYMPGLIVINNRFESTGNDQGGTAELDAVGNWVTDWGKSFNDPKTQPDFKACQDQVSDALYYSPAMKAATKWGAKSALSRAALYDAFINHGEDGALAFVKKANQVLGDTGQVAPAVGFNGITEDAWLKAFIEARRDTLASDSTWADAIDRIAGYEKLRRRANWDLSAPFRNDVRALDCWAKGYKDSGYTVRQIEASGAWSTPSAVTYSCN